MAAPKYSIRVGGKTLTAINTINLRFSMRELADSFSAQISDKVDIAAGDRVEVSVEGRVVLVGEVQTVRLVKQAGARDLTINGFSAAQRLVKSAVVPGDGVTSRTIKDRTLEEIVTDVVRPFGLVVDVSESAAEIAREKIDKVRIVAKGQTALDFLTKVCKRQGCILVSGAASIRPDGTAKSSVRITRVATRMSPIPIVYPGVIAIDYEDDVRDVHSEYSVTRKGGGVRGADGTIAGLDGRATDERVLYSPIIIKAEAGGKDQASIDRQAEWEMRKRAAEGQRVSVTVSGWSPRPSPTPPSPLWWPNTLQRVVDTEDGFDQIQVLASVELTDSVGSGALARLELMPPDAYAVLKKMKIPKGKRGYKGNKEWLQQHADLVSQIDAVNDKFTFDQTKTEIIWTPEDPSA